MSRESDNEIAEESLQYHEDQERPTHVCAVCGTEIDRHEWHPVASKTNGAVHIFLFCEQRCRTTWIENQADSR
ncbi:DUF7576 family protein [Haloarchaeobius sp. TZWSO28]|uniref:DUF7576 family protein n=1 Tax=Haloarchaeobius sp. TZWSO28 TaxID=3446119 RepID=UPI003EBB8E15